MAASEFFQRLSMGFGNLLIQLTDINNDLVPPAAPPPPPTPPPAEKTIFSLFPTNFASTSSIFFREQLTNYTPRLSNSFRLLISWWFGLSTALGSVVLAYAVWTCIARNFLLKSRHRQQQKLNAKLESLNSSSVRFAAGRGAKLHADKNSIAKKKPDGGGSTLINPHKKSAAAMQLNEISSDDELESSLSHLSHGMQQEELLQILRPIRMFCELGNEIIFELIKHIETVHKKQGDMLFNIGQPDDSIYLIQKGVLSLEVAKDPVLNEIMRMKTVTSGDSVYSVLSFVDYLTGHAGQYKTVRCRVLADSIVLRIRFEVIASVLNTRPEWMLKCIQIITSRIQRVTLTALNNYLGLNNELLKTSNSQSSPNVAAAPENSTTLSSEENSTEIPQSSIRPLQRDQTFHAGVDRLQKYLGIKNPNVLRDLKLIYGEVQPNVTIIEEETDSALVYLLNGQLTAYMRKKFPCDNDLIDPRTAATFNPTVLGPTTVPVSSTADLNPNEEIVEVFRATYNQLVGATAILSGETSLMTVRALEKCRVIVIPRSQFYKAMKREPNIVLPVANSIVSRLSPFVRQIDFAIEWSTISSGVRLYRQGDLPSNLYVVISGRFRSFYRPPPHPSAAPPSPTTRTSAESENDQLQSEHQRHFFESKQENLESSAAAVQQHGQRRPSLTFQQPQRQQQQNSNNTHPVVFVDEYGNGDLVGLAELSAMERRLTTMLAVRDSEVARIPAEVFEIIKMKFPKVTARIVRMLGMGLMGRCREDPRTMMGSGFHHSIPQAQHNGGGGNSPGNGMFHISTLAVVTLSPLTPSTCFCMELQKCFIHSGYQCNRISRTEITEHLGLAALRPGNDFRLASWLTQQEEENKVLVLECDWPCDMREPKLGYLNEVFLRQSDCILYLAVAEQATPEKSVFEQEVEKRFPRVRKELVLLHLPTITEIRGTPAWLELRPHVNMFYHVKMSVPYMTYGNEGLAFLIGYFASEYKFNVHGDVPRIVRTLTGRAIGLVLGGGGARGYGHLPVIQKTLDSDIPIDFVGGTSIGSFVGAIYAMWKDKDVLYEKALAWADFMNNPLKYLYDLTWPRVAYFSGGEFNKGIYMVLANRQIEDMWLPYYCITADVTDFKKRVHTRGTAWRAVRASMTLAGYLPPMCDERDGHLLLDGGYVDNLPVDIMIEQMGVRNVIAVDVSRHVARQNTNYGDTLSGWWLFWRQAIVERFWPWPTTRVEIPSSIDIQTRLTYMMSEYYEDLLQRTKVHVHLRPPVQQFTTMAFAQAQRIVALSTEYVEKVFAHEQSEQLRKMKQMASGPAILHEHERRKLNFGASPGSRQTSSRALETLPDEPIQSSADKSGGAATSHSRQRTKTLRSFRTFSITDLASIIAAQEIKSINSRTNSMFIPESSTIQTNVSSDNVKIAVPASSALVEESDDDTTKLLESHPDID